MAFAKISGEYQKKGYSVIPIKVGTKAPFFHDWSNYCKKLTTSEEVATWSKKFPNNNIGICCGPASGVVWIDLDLDINDKWQSEIYNAIKTLIPDSPVEKKGAKGFSRAYKYNGEKSESLRVGSVTVIDLLSDGRQTVIPPSIHSKTGMPYVWTSKNDLLEISKDQLPVLPANFVGTVRKVLSNFDARVGMEGEGRHNRLKNLVFALFHEGKNKDEIASKVVEYDKKFFRASYLSDSSEPGMRHGTTNQNAKWLVESMEKSFNRINLKLFGTNECETQRKKWPKPIGDEAFFGELQTIVQLIEPHTEADPVAILAQLLVTLGSIFGDKSFVRVDGTKHHSNLFSVIVGKSSKARKGTSLSHVMNIVKVVDRAWFKNRNKSGLASGEGLIWEVRDGEDEKEKGVTDKRLMLIETEFASTLRVLDREGNTLSPVLRNAWDSRNLAILSRQSKATATNPHISVIGHITEEELNKLLKDNEKANGFGNRFIWICVERKRLLPSGGQAHTLDWEPTILKLCKAVEFAKSAGEIRIAPGEALDHWIEIYESYSEERRGLFGAMTARAESQILRLALIYALVDCSSEIQIQHLRAAEAFWSYCESSSFYLFGNKSKNPMANELLNAIRSKDDGLTRTEIRDYFDRNKSKEDIQMALDELIHSQMVEKFVESSNGRKPTQRFIAKFPMENSGGSK